MQDARHDRRPATRRVRLVEAMTSRFDAEHGDVLSSRKGWNRPMAFDPPPMQATSKSGRRPCGQHLCARFLADHALEIAHEFRIGVRACRRADDVESVMHIGDPVAQRLRSSRP
jgi:hypothetical protein